MKRRLGKPTKEGFGTHQGRIDEYKTRGDTTFELTFGTHLELMVSNIEIRKTNKQIHPVI